jgi:hypothetical protein
MQIDTTLFASSENQYIKLIFCYRRASSVPSISLFKEAENIDIVMIK